MTFLIRAGTMSCPVNSSRSAWRNSAKTCLTSRSSREWNVMTTHLPHLERSLTVSLSDVSIDLNSSLTAMRIPWKLLTTDLES